jgi:hypothetical protein
MLANLGSGRHAMDIPLAVGRWRKVFDSTESRWGGTGSASPGGVDVGKKISIALGAYAAVLFQQESRA